MNVWIVNQYAIPPSQAGGTRHYMLGKELARRGHSVSLIAASFDHVQQVETRLEPGESWKLESVESVQFLWLRTPAYSGNGGRRMLNMAAFATRLWWPSTTEALPRPDVIIGSSPTLFAARAALALAKRWHVPFVLEVRDLWPQTLVDLGKVRDHHPVVIALEQIERKLYREAAEILALLPNAANHMVKRGASLDKITWLPNGVNIANAPQPIPPRDRGILQVTYAGTHGLANGLDTLLDTAAHLQHQGVADIRFRLIGDGPDKPRLMQRASANNLANVCFEAPVAKAAIFGALSESDIFVATLRNAPLFRHGISPNKLYDYMAAARPVVLSADTAGDPIRQSGCGFVVPPESPTALGDALLKLRAMEAEHRWQMGMAGRRFVERHHSISVLGERLEIVLHRAVANARPVEYPIAVTAANS